MVAGAAQILWEGVIVLEQSGGRISAWNTFLDTEKLFPLFGLPLHMSD